MARNLRPGPDWIPGTIAEVLGPVTYIIETDEGQRWKRHADQIKSWIAPTLRVEHLETLTYHHFLRTAYCELQDSTSNCT